MSTRPPKVVTGTISATIPFARADPAPPHTFMFVADQLMPAIQVLGRASPPCDVGLAMLCGHALECILKAYLSRDGDLVAAKKLKSNPRHNLEKAWERARMDGLPLAATLPDWAATLHTLHTDPDHILRYVGKANVLHLPVRGPMVSGLTELRELVRSRLR